jgi:hypothetical protein
MSQALASLNGGRPVSPIYDARTYSMFDHIAARAEMKIAA